MDLSYTEEQESIRKMVRELAFEDCRVPGENLIGERVEQKKPDRKLSSMAKYFCCESAKRAADHAVQIHGATGYMDECAVSRYYRDIRAATIADGTTEIQKWIIARELGC